ncbi:hypothetical protein Bca52824_085864 [Brassica carinata]|uniref:Uncharacterized protein n=1 Tax=Brassica carinata TaxID=52824 RepID=A0A8X7P6Q1_BRACI|nr:hypothetical protein Bca52824_085864 [Brassica carinata]
MYTRENNINITRDNTGNYGEDSSRPENPRHRRRNKLAVLDDGEREFHDLDEVVGVQYKRLHRLRFKGNIIYRVDNYNSKSCREVYLMDLHGRVLLTLRRQKFGLFKTWEGYRSPTGTAESATNLDYFRVKNNMFKIPSKDSSSSYRVTTGSCRNDEEYCYKIVTRGSSLGIEESCGRLVAEVKRKQSRNGLELGDDVLTMMVESQVDHSFIIGLVLTHSLINCKL